MCNSLICCVIFIIVCLDPILEFQHILNFNKCTKIRINNIILLLDVFFGLIGYKISLWCDYKQVFSAPLLMNSKSFEYNICLIGLASLVRFLQIEILYHTDHIILLFVLNKHTNIKITISSLTKAGCIWMDSPGLSSFDPLGSPQEDGSNCLRVSLGSSL